MTPNVRRALVVACVVLVGLAFALAYGTSFGSKNQQTYLLDVLVRAYPELYRNDWFVSQNHHYHVAFAYVTAPLYAIDASGARAFGVAQVVTMIATFAAIFGLIAAVTTHARLVIFVGIVGLLALGGGRSLGGSYLYGGYVQPSTLATLGWLVAMNFWIRGRIFHAGIALAIGAVFHLNYAVLGIGMFGLCELASHRFDARRLAMLLGPSIVVLALFLPTMLASSHTSHDKLALDVLVRFIFPNHFKPSRLRIELLSLVGWQLISLGFRPTDRTETPESRLFWFGMVVMSSCIVAVVLVQIPPLLSLTRLFTWRVAPFGVLAAQILMFLGVRAIATRERPLPRGWELVGLILGAALVIYNAFTRPRAIYPEVITCVMLVAAATIALRRVSIGAAACALLCIVGLWTEHEHLTSPIVFQSYEAGVTEWARTKSPRDAVFLTPPYYGDFRLLSRRAVIADDKSPPMYLEELVTWYQRLCAMVDAKTLVSLEDAWTRWDALTPEQLVTIARHFHADYIVLDKPRSTARLTAPVAFEDDGNVVYSIAP